MSELLETKICFFDIPFEIRSLIYSYFTNIKDTENRLSIRNVCSEWRDLITDITIYDENNNIKLIHKFQNNQLKTFFANGCIKKKILFEPYAKFKYVEYNENRKLIKIIENFPPYEIVIHEKIDNIINTKKINLLTYENSIKLSKKYKCMNYLNPILEDEDILFNTNQHLAYFSNPNNFPACSIS